MQLPFLPSPQMQPPRSRAPGGRSLVIKRSIVIGGMKTSISIEDPFWSQLHRLAEEKHLTLSELAGSIEDAMAPGQINLSSAIRLYVLREILSEKEATAPPVSATAIATTANDNPQ